MRVEIGALVSKPAGGAAVARRVTGRALELVARQVEAEFGSGLDLQLGRVKVDSGLALGGIPPDGEDAAAAVLAERIFAAVRPQLTVLRPVSYTAGRSIGSLSGPVTPRSRGLWDQLRGRIGGNGVKVELPKGEDLGPAGEEYFALMQGFLAHYDEQGSLPPGAIAQAIAATKAQLERQDVVFSQSDDGKYKGAIFRIKPRRTGSRLNVIAWTAKRQLGIGIEFNVKERVLGQKGVGSFSSDDKMLYLDTRSIALGAPAGTALHELHHAHVYDRMKRTDHDSFLHYKMRSLRGTSMPAQGAYGTSMSAQEFATFARQPRQILGIHLKTSAAWSEALREDLRVYLWKLRNVLKNGTDVPDRLMPQLEAYLKEGKKTLSFGTAGDGDLMLIFNAPSHGLHHVIDLHVVTEAQKRAAKALRGKESEAARRTIAADLLNKLRVTRELARVLLLQADVVEREISKLKPGQPLTPGDQRALKDILAWPSYALRVADAAGLSDTERMQELARQLTLAQGRLDDQA